MPIRTDEPDTSSTVTVTVVADENLLAGLAGDHEHGDIPVAANGAAGLAGGTCPRSTSRNSG